MKINGEAVYGTKRWSTLREGPTQMEMKSTTYREEHGYNLQFTPEDFWFTAKDNTVYVISLANPRPESAAIKALSGCKSRIRSIRLLGHEESLAWQGEGDKVIVTLPDTGIPSGYGFALKIELE